MVSWGRWKHTFCAIWHKVLKGVITSDSRHQTTLFLQPQFSWYGSHSALSHPSMVKQKSKKQKEMAAPPTSVLQDTAKSLSAVIPIRRLPCKVTSPINGKHILLQIYNAIRPFGFNLDESRKLKPRHWRLSHCMCEYLKGQHWLCHCCSSFPKANWSSLLT